MPRFDYELFLRFIQDYRITHLYRVPPIVLALAKQSLVDQYDLSSLRCILSGAAPLDGAIQQVVAARLHVPVVQGYGMTETSLAIALTPPDSASVKKYKGMQVAPAELEGVLLTHRRLRMRP